MEDMLTKEAVLCRNLYGRTVFSMEKKGAQYRHYMCIITWNAEMFRRLQKEAVRIIPCLTVVARKNLVAMEFY